MIIWITVSIIGASALGLLIYKKKVKNGRTENSLDPEVKDDYQKDDQGSYNKKLFSKFDDTAVRSTPSVDNGTLGMGSNLIGRVKINTLIGTVKSEGIGHDGYVWYSVTIDPKSALKKAVNGYVRSDVATLK